MDRIKKFTTVLTLFLYFIQLNAQEKSTIYFGAGINTFNSDVNESEFLNSDFGFNAGFFTPLLKKDRFNLGLNLSGTYSFATDDFGDLPTVIPIVPSDGLTLETSSNSVNQSLLQFGLGPQFNFKLGNNFWLSPVVQGGYFKFDQDELVLTQESDFNDRTFTTDVFRQDAVSESGFFIKPALRLNYQIAENWNLWGESNYFIANANTTQNQLVPLGEPNEQGEYFFDQIIGGAAGDQVFVSTESETSLNSFGINFGLAYSFGGKNGNEDMSSTQRAQDYNSSRSNKPSSIAADSDADREDKDEAVTKAQDYNSSRSNKPSSVAFTNPLKERNEKKKSKCELISISPINNSNFVEANEIKNFKWEVIGDKIPNPQFIIEVTKVNSNQQPLRTYIAKTSKTSISAKEVFKGTELTDGQYRWKVTQVSNGNGGYSYCGETNHLSFFISNCEIDFSITNEEIECLGYEGENRKYKICFDSNYSSTSGDLTFADVSSGLSVFDQSYAALSYTLVSPNPTLQTQTGSTSSTVSYCFEVTVPASVTEIGFGIQGDDLDPSPVTCQPGVSEKFDELPDCICDECEDIELSFDDYTISMNGTSGNQFNINGNINVNVPVYGIEVQIQSYSYSANPSACTDGVSSVEESGMILMPGTSINGSTSLQLANESVSGSPNSNNNATKNITYTSTSALTGAIPVNLTIGLPEPLSGLNPDCCKIDYSVCVKIKVIYDETNCKTCVFTHCFTFNNQ